MRALAAIALAIFCAVTPSLASAQTRDTPYTVSGVPAEATAANAAQAQTQALANAQRVGFERLVRRITPDADVQRLGLPATTPQQLDLLVSSLDIQDERRSSTRYIARVKLNFEANGVRNLLRGAGYSIVDTRTAPILVVPQAPGAPESAAAAWRAAWAEGGFNEELVPMPTAPAGLEAAQDWNALAGAVQNAGAATALIATMRLNGASAAATLVELGPNGARRDRGAVQARVQGGEAGLRPALNALAAEASQRVQGEWKARAASASTTRARVSASAVYQQQSEWEAIKAGLEASAATVISEIRIEAVGRGGALVSFSYLGDQMQLVSELRRHGVSLENADIGPVLRTVRR